MRRPPRDLEFRLDNIFISSYVPRVPKWGPLGYVTYKRTYARDITTLNPRYQWLAEEHEVLGTEEWWLTVVRVVEGTYRIQEAHCKHLHLFWDADKAQRSAQEMYDLIFNFKFLPPGRGLWMMGTDYVMENGGAALNNCGMVSSENIKTSFSDPFCWLMDMSMLGVGVGFDTKGAGTITIQEPEIGPVQVVEDTREGWVDLIRRLLDAYVNRDTLPVDTDVSKVRLANEPIKGFGGTSSGPGPLLECYASIEAVLRPLIGKKITVEAIVDINNLLGRCVVAGNVRRSAEISFGEADDEVFLNLKNPETNQEALDHHRWASNNSVFAYVGMDYTRVAELTAKNGEPGYLWLDNAREFSRMGHPPDFKDEAAKGANPCQPATATVLTPAGIRTFADIDVGSVIWSGKQWTTVTHKKYTGEKLVYKYHTTAGVFEGTENHRVVSNGVKVEVKDAQSIDVCPLPKQANKCEGTFRIAKVEDCGVQPVWDITVEAEEHTYWTGGLLVSNCVEQTLFDRELCCLVESFPSLHTSYVEYQRTLKFAYLYAKTVTLWPTHDSRTNAVMMQNRRIGTSMTGIIQAFNKHGKRNVLNWASMGYSYLGELDRKYSSWLAVPLSIKRTSVKPSGTVSLLAGVTPGVHHPHSEYYHRVIRFRSNSTMVPQLKANGYVCVELDPNKEPNTTAVYFPVKEEYFNKSKYDVTMWEQLEIAAQLQYHWADNQVSATVTFTKDEGKEIKDALELYETRLKGISFLPLTNHGYEHAPYQTITKEEYEAYSVRVTPVVKFEEKTENEVIEKFCDGDSCVI